jgi:hypothetical protein
VNGGLLPLLLNNFQTREFFNREDDPKEREEKSEEKSEEKRLD